MFFFNVKIYFSLTYFFDSNWNFFFSSNLLNFSFPVSSGSSRATKNEKILLWARSDDNVILM